MAHNITKIEYLLNEVRSCSLCVEHLPLDPKPVLQLIPEARILVAGQAPGRKVHESGMPFTAYFSARK